MLFIAFFLATAALFLQTLIHPIVPILAYSPFLALAILRCRRISALWISAGAGAILDLLSDDPMGQHALNYVLCVAFLYRYRQHFLYDAPFHVSLLTAILSAFSTALHLFLLFLFDRRVPFSGKWLFADILGMPVMDALYAFVWFSAPLALFERLRRMWVLFWLKKKSLSQSSR